MKLVKAKYEITTPINGEEILKAIELAARTCYQSEGKIEYEDKWIDKGNAVIRDYAKSARILIPKLISRGHFAMLEFGGMITVRFTVDRGVSHELVRHRLASFAQESTRYCNYEGKDMEFIIPCWFNNTIESLMDIKLIETANCDQNEAEWRCVCENAEESYNYLINKGWSPQQARSVLPNSLKTEINMSCNIREWREVFKQRCANAAHPQMQEVMRPLLVEFQQRIPILFDDIKY